MTEPTAVRDRAATTIGAYLEELASASPTPGGGSASAIAGALAAGLVAMVCRITLAGKSSAAAAEVMPMIADRADEIRLELLDLAREDEHAYREYRLAVSLPKSTEADQVYRRDAVQRALGEAAAVPRTTSRTCLTVLHLAETSAQHANAHVLSDITVAIELGEAAVAGALANVDVNARSITDPLTRQQLERQVDSIRSDAQQSVVRTRATLQGRSG